MQQLVVRVFDCPYSFHLLRLRPATICLAPLLLNQTKRDVELVSKCTFFHIGHHKKSYMCLTKVCSQTLSKRNDFYRDEDNSSPFNWKFILLTNQWGKRVPNCPLHLSCIVIWINFLFSHRKINVVFWVWVFLLHCSNQQNLKIMHNQIPHPPGP